MFILFCIDVCLMQNRKLWALIMSKNDPPASSIPY